MSKWIKNWFSNMLPFDRPMEYGKLRFSTVENFYQAMKIPKDRPELRAQIASMSPQMAKVNIRKKNLFPWRKDWNREMALEVMEYALRYKFAKGTTWADMLLDTGDEEIIEFNNWGDTFWGHDVRFDKGDNMLGKILMKIREDLRKQDEKI